MEALQKDGVKKMAAVSTLLRNAISAALPVAPSQYMTVSIPGTVIDLVDYDEGGSFVYDVGKHAMPPTTVRQSEARLVDGMMPLANIMIGNTGKSVARSYSRSLDGLLPAKATYSSKNGIRSPGNSSYDDAMEYLRRPQSDGRSIVEHYRDKQVAWGESRALWDKAKAQAEIDAEKAWPSTAGGDYIGKQKQWINDWNQQHYYEYKAGTQAAWMDWVVNGHKYDVDYNFGLIDIDSITGRIEASKESLRNSTIPDADGANEVYGVTLSPAQWATYCKRKAEGWYDRNGRFTLAQLDAEIARLTSLLGSFQTAEIMVTDPGKVYPVHNAKEPTVKLEDTKAALDQKTRALYQAQGDLAGVKQNTDQVLSRWYSSEADKNAAKAELKQARDNAAKAEAELQEAQKNDDDAHRDWNEYKKLAMDDDTRNSVTGWMTTKQDTINKELDRLKKLRAEKLQSNPVTVPVITGATAPAEGDTTTPHGTEHASEGSEYANPVFQSATTQSSGGATSTSGGSTAPAPTAAEYADPWTNITFSYSAADVSSYESEDSWGMKVGGSVGFGLWSVGGAYAHDESHSDMQSDMAECDVSISFSALVVNIDRPWLYGELFEDLDLEVADGVRLSPGPQRMQRYISKQTLDQIGLYSDFPAYPTSFIVAADTTIEFNGATKHIEKHFEQNSNSGSVSLGYGPWSVSTSFNQKSTNQSMQMHTTATGCKLTFGAPQIIAWVSEILPALPRDSYNPLTQGAGIPVPS